MSKMNGSTYYYSPLMELDVTDVSEDPAKVISDIFSRTADAFRLIGACTLRASRLEQNKWSQDIVTDMRDAVNKFARRMDHISEKLTRKNGESGRVSKRNGRVQKVIRSKKDRKICPLSAPTITAGTQYMHSFNNGSNNVQSVIPSGGVYHQNTTIEWIEYSHYGSYDKKIFEAKNLEAHNPYF